MNGVTRNKLDGLWSQLLATIAVHFEHYVLTVWPQKHQAALPPTIQRSGGRVKGGAVDAETAWHVLARSHVIYSATPGVVTAVLNDTDAFKGLSSRTGEKCSETQLPYLQSGDALSVPHSAVLVFRSAGLIRSDRGRGGLDCRSAFVSGSVCVCERHASLYCRRSGGEQRSFSCTTTCRS